MARPEKMVALFLGLFLVTQIVPIITVEYSDYMHLRSRLAESEHCGRMGADLHLRWDEQLLSDFVRMKKQKMIFNVRKTGSQYMPAASFYLSKKWSFTDPIFNVVKQTPKGAALHLHELALTSLDWLVLNVTYRNYVYMCITNQGYVQLNAFKKLPDNPECPWKLVRTERDTAFNPVIFDVALTNNLSLLATDPVKAYDTSVEAQKRLDIYLKQVGNLIRKPTILKDYLTEAVREFVVDKVDYMEIRATLSGMVDEYGNPVSPEDVAKMYQDVAKSSVNKYRDFRGLRIIHTSPRYWNEADVLKEIKLAMALKNKFPDLVVGFDIVGYENFTSPLVSYLKALLFPSQADSGGDLRYFLHAAETKWYGTDADLNILDALMLNASRIGHAYSATKHPKIWAMLQEKRTCVEVNPISNQIMGLVKDFRDHAMIPLFRKTVPLVISSDYPGAWRALPMSHDLYVTVMNFVPFRSELPTMKQLAINSIEYSALSNEKRTDLYNTWLRQWEVFISEHVSKYKLKESRPAAGMPSDDVQSECLTTFMEYASSNAARGCRFHVKLFPFFVYLHLIFNNRLLLLDTALCVCIHVFIWH